MTYNALQATLQHRQSNGLQYQVAYTYSHCLTNSSGYYGSWGGQTTPASPYWQNLYDPRAEWGDCYYDVKHDLTAFAVYQLPFGNGKKFGNDAGKAKNAADRRLADQPDLDLARWFPVGHLGGDETGTDSSGGSRADCCGSRSTSRRYVSTGQQQRCPAVVRPDGVLQSCNLQFGTCNVTPGPRSWFERRGPESLQKSFISRIEAARVPHGFPNLFNHPILTSPNSGCGGGAGDACSSDWVKSQVQKASAIFSSP